MPFPYDFTTHNHSNVFRHTHRTHTSHHRTSLYAPQEILLQQSFALSVLRPAPPRSLSPTFSFQALRHNQGRVTHSQNSSSALPFSAFHSPIVFPTVLCSCLSPLPTFYLLIASSSNPRDNLAPSVLLSVALFLLTVISARRQQVMMLDTDFATSSHSLPIPRPRPRLRLPSPYPSIAGAQQEPS
ncbi:hypothetical protein V8E36_004514 [Tilletia maclaganii]